MQPANGYNLSGHKFAGTYRETDPRTDARGRRHHDLDRVDRLDVEAKQPGRGSAGEDSLSRERALPCRKQLPWILFDLRIALDLGADASPGLAGERAQREPSRACLLEGEWPLGKFARDAWRARHIS